MQPYSQDHSSVGNQSSLRSANEVVPFIMDILEPKTVIDIGCGLGAWLSTFRNFGVEEVMGIDGDYVDLERLEISRECFLPHNLVEPLELQRNFDLVLSLEVAEHLPSEVAETFVDTLVNLGSAILFSAAPPYQPGDFHVNCQWPDYWANLFFQRGYVLFDCLRMKFWQNENVDWWYSQNMLLFVRRSSLPDYPKLTKSFSYSNLPPVSIVHPRLYLMHCALDLEPNCSDLNSRSIDQLLTALKSVLIERSKQKLGWLFQNKRFWGS